MAEELEAGPPTPATTVRVITETRNLRSPPFIAPEEPSATGNAWEEWLEGIEREFRYFKITNPEDRKDALIIYGGKQVAKLEKSLPNPASGDPYEKLRQKLNDHYLPKKNKHYARYQFLKLRPNAGESTSSYAARLRERATDCEFGDTHDDRILEHIIQTTENKTLIQKSINKAWTLTQFLVEAAQTENIKRQVSDITSPEAEVKVRCNREAQGTQSDTREINRIQSPEKQHQPRSSRSHMKQEQERRRRTSPTAQQCQYCGYNHRKGDNCPAFGKRCRKCNKENHFSSVCRSTGNTRVDSQKQGTGPNNQRGRIKRTTEEDSSISSDDDYFVEAVTSSFQAKKITGPQKRKQTVTVRLNDVDIRMEPDSGAEVNLMDEHQFQALLHRTKEKPTLEHCKIKLNTLQHPLNVKGKFETIIRNQTCGKPATFVVGKGRINSPPLLSKNTLIELGMLKLQPDGGLTSPNAMRMENDKPKTVKSTTNQPERQEMDQIIAKYDHLFQGIGRITDKKKIFHFIFCRKF